MKIRLHSISAIALALALASCADTLEEPIEQMASQENGLRFTASFVTDESTRTALMDDGMTVQWNPTDVIKIIPANSELTSVSASIISLSEDQKTAVFEAEKAQKTYTPVFAVYPSSVSTSVCEGEESLTSFKLTIPETQEGAFANANIAVSEVDGSRLAFKNACGIFKIRAWNGSAKAIKIRGTNICGTFKVSFADGKPVLAQEGELGNVITLSNIDHGIDYYVSVAPGHYDDLSFTVENSSGGEVITVDYGKGIDVTPGMLVNWENISAHGPACLPVGGTTTSNPFNSALLELAKREDVLRKYQIKKITFVVNSPEPKQEGEVVFANIGTPVYASMDSETGFVTIRTSASEFVRAGGGAGMNYWFYDLRNLEEIVGFEHINTSSVKTMSGLFDNCEALKTVNLSNINLSSATDISCMFSGCEKIELNDLSFLGTGSPNLLNALFSGCESVTTLNLSSLNTQNATTFRAMFMDCMNLKTLILPETFMTSKCKDACFMFDNCRSLESLDASKLKISGTWGIEAMFRNCYKLVLQNESTLSARCWNYKYVFQNCTSMVNLDLRNLMSYWYNNDALSMFEGCTKLESINLSNFGGEGLNNAKALFKGCTNLKSVDLSSWTTEDLTSLESAFQGCENLDSLDLSSFHTSNVTTMKNMLNGAYRLKSLTLGENFTISNTCRNASAKIFGPSDKLMGYLTNNIPYTEINCSSDTWSQLNAMLGDDAVYYTPIIKAYLPSGKDFNEAICALGGSVESINFIVGEEKAGGTIINPGLNASAPTIYASNNSGEVKVWTSADAMMLNADCEGMFKDFDCMESISGLNDLLADNVTTMKEMFAYCSSLESIQPVGWTAPGLTTVESMFKGCEALKNVYDLSSMVSANLTNMAAMFYNCLELKTVGGLAAWNTSNVTTMKNLFNCCTELTSVVFGNWDTGAVTDMSGMFQGCSSMYDFAGINNWDTSSCTDMSYMFSGVGATSLDISNFNTANVKSMQGMFCGNDFTKLNVSNFNTSNVTDMSYMFSESYDMEYLNLKNFDTRKVTDFTEMFSFCPKLKGLHLRGAVASNFVFDSSADMTDIFGKSSSQCMGVKNELPYTCIYINPDSYEVLADKLGDLAGYYCYQYVPAYLPKGTDFQTLIGNLSKTAGISPKKVNFLKLEARPASVSGAVRVDDGSLGTPIYMAMDSEGIVDIWTAGGWFYLNEDSKSMFHTWDGGESGARCNKVTEITGLEFCHASYVTTMEAMFYGCSSLSDCDFRYWETQNVTNMSGMFYNCQGLMDEDMDLSAWNTSKVTTMRRMFYGCSRLTSLQLNNFDTSNVTSMAGMFQGCTQLNFVNILKFDNGKVTNMGSMFNGCINLAQIVIGQKFGFDGKTTDSIFYNLGTNRSSTPYCTFSCYQFQKEAIQSILGTSAGNYAFSVHDSL